MNSDKMKADEMKAEKVFQQFEQWELEAFSEGAEMPRLAEFTKQHPELWSAWLDNFRREQKNYAKLYRFDCPSPDEIREYYWSMLASEKHKQISSHLDVCLTCTGELRTLEESLAVGTEHTVARKTEVPPFSQLREKLEAIADSIKWTIATLVTPSTQTLSPAALRSNDVAPTLNSAHPSTLLFETDDVDLNLIIQAGAGGTIRLGGQILASLSFDNAQIKITSDDPQRPTVHTSVNDVGEFSVGELEPGTYQFLLTFPDNTIVIPNLIIK